MFPGKHADLIFKSVHNIPVESGVLKIADLHRQIAIFENISPTIWEENCLVQFRGCNKFQVVLGLFA